MATRNACALNNHVTALMPDRLVLPGVPKVGFYSGGQRCPEDVPFPACLRAILDYLGEGLGSRLLYSSGATWRLDHTYTYLMGVSGCAFRLSWKPGWHADNVEIMYMSDDPAAPFTRACAAIGYEPVIIDPYGIHDNEDIYREAVWRSLYEQGRPLIAFGVIGPPEACLVTGYDAGGDILIGWNFFQDDPEFQVNPEYEPCGAFRRAGWFEHTQSLLLLGEKRPIPSHSEIYRQALGWALQVMRTTLTFGDRQNGQAAYSAWAAHLLDDSAFPAGAADVLQERFFVHDDAVGTLAEGRWYAARFMELIAESEPEMSVDLISASACFDAEHDLMWQIWGLVGGNGCSPENVRRLADPAIRRQIARLILLARDQDMQAAGCLEQALAR